MKKTALSSVFALLALLGVGCGPLIEGSGNVISEMRQVSDFDQVDLLGIGELYITQGNEETLRIEAEDNLIPYITTDVHDHVLEIGFKPMVRVWPKQQVRFYLTLKNVSALRVSGSGDIHAERLAAEKLQLTISGSGDMTIDQINAKALTNTISGSGDLHVGALKADSVKTTLTGSGTCDLTGETAEQSARLTGSGDYRAADLQSQTASVNLSGSGNVRAWVIRSLEVSVVGSGDVKYYGAPTVSKRVAGSGNVTSLGSH